MIVRDQLTACGLERLLPESILFSRKPVTDDFDNKWEILFANLPMDPNEGEMTAVVLAHVQHYSRWEAGHRELKPSWTVVFSTLGKSVS